MTLSRITLKQWRIDFEKVEDRCPWPGPRPLRRGDGALLVGRYEDAENFRAVMESENRLILVSGPSGVGKSSLLQAGLIPNLREAGFLVLAADKWGSSSHTDALRFLEETLLNNTLQDAGPEAIADLVADGTFLVRLQREYPGRAVLVLDQFEELIRYSPAMKQRIFDLLLRINRHLNIKIVLSFRSEYLHEFEELENQANQYTLTYFPLKPIDGVYAEEVVESGNKKTPGSITSDAVEWVAERWRHEMERTDDVGITDPFGRVGLLHLQAMLYALFFAADDEIVDGELVEELQASGRLVDEHGQRVSSEIGKAARSEFETGGGYFPEAIVGAIGLKLRHCNDAGRDLDQYLLEGTTSMLTRSVAHLSSAGYKLIREMWDLAEVTMGSDLDALEEGLAETHGPCGDDQKMALSAALAAIANPFDPDPPDDDLLTAEVRTIAEAADALHPLASALWVQRIHGGTAPFGAAYAVDELEVTSGAAAGLPPGIVLIEEFRRFHFALAWLLASSLVRITNPGSGERVGDAMVSLIHDGFGRPLREWSAKLERSTASALHALTAPRDATFFWKREGNRLEDRTPDGTARKPDVGGPGRHRVVPNLRWRGGWVRADFQRVIFANCDFRGTLFDRCRFEGVNFVNCILDGTIFSECRIDGSIDPLEHEVVWTFDEPTFDVEADPRLIASFASYGTRSSPSGKAFFSGLPGTPAVPRTSEAPVLPSPSHPVVDGGLAVYGGRISSLGMRRCEIVEGSGVGLRHTTGSGLELVELVGRGRYDIFGSALRHVTFSSQPEIDEVPEIDVDVKNSLLSQLWVSGGIEGKIDVLDCTVVQAWNGADVKLKISNSLVHGIIGPVVRDDRTLHLDDDSFDLDTILEDARVEKLAKFAEQSLRADYRQNPARTAALRQQRPQKGTPE